MIFKILLKNGSWNYFSDSDLAAQYYNEGKSVFVSDKGEWLEWEPVTGGN